MRNLISVKKSLFAMALLLPLAPFALYYVWFFSLYLGDYVAVLLFEGSEISLLIAPPENHLWYTGSKWLACVAIALLITNVILTRKIHKV
jgi:hypothetical protein